jgi:hypothetical protein
VTNCLIVGNRATALDGGAGIGCLNSDAVFVNCTIAGNSAASTGAGVYLIGSSAVLLNSIVWDNTPTQVQTAGKDDSVIDYTNVAGGWPGTMNLDADPYFAQPGYWTYETTDEGDPAIAGSPSVWVLGDYHVMSQAGRWDLTSGTWINDKASSPCIDAGDPSMPVAAEPSPNGDRINMGAYGGTAEASKSP